MNPAIVPASEHACLLRCYVQPRASRCQIAGLHDGELKVVLTSPPVDGQANAMLCKYFAGLLNLSRQKVTLKSGLASRHKVLSIDGLGAEELEKKLQELSC